MRSVNKQPSAKPDAGCSAGDKKDQAELSIVSGPEEVKERAGNHTRTGDQEGQAEVTREDAPHGDGETKHEVVNSSKN